MKIRHLLTAGAIAGLVMGPTFAWAADPAPANTSAGKTAQPLPAGGPAAQSEAGPQIGSVMAIGGLLFVVTAAGLVLIGNNNGSSPSTATTSTTP